MSSLYNQGYHLYIDNWYTSEKLFRHLESEGTVACGTWMGHRLKIPESLKEERLEKGDFRFRRDGNLLLVRYKDKKEIYFLSLIHGIKIERVPKRGREETAASKLSLVKDYNKFMGGVDRNEALIGNYSSVRKTLKWTVKVVFHFIEEAFLNAYIFNEKFSVKKCVF